MLPTSAALDKLVLPSLPVLSRSGSAVEFTVQGAELPPAPSAALTAACHLIPCMAARRTLPLPEPLDARLALGLPKLIQLLAEWNPTLHSISVKTASDKPCVPPSKGTRGVAACFTGGVDSFYTLVTRRGEIDTLIYVLGYDLQQKQETLWQQVRTMIEAVAAHYQKRLIVVRTNLRRFLDPLLPWGMTHGTGLAAVGHLLSNEIQRLIIPTGFAANQQQPWGSHPELDPLWSSQALEIEHDSIEPTRLEKLRRLAEEEFPLRHLRVCWKNPDQTYNCGKCAKCFRTVAGLAALGALGRTQVFPPRPDLAAAARLDLGEELDALYLAEVRAELDRTGREPDLNAFLHRLPGADRSLSVPFARLRHQNRRQKEPLVVRAARLSVASGQTELRAEIQWGDLRTVLEVAFDLGGEAPGLAGDALLLWMVLPAMRSGVPLVLEDPVSADLLEGISHAQGFWSSHRAFAGHSRIAIHAPEMPRSRKPETERPWAVAFSGGVDAMFTARSERQRIGFLVWIDGMDSEAVDPSGRHRTHRWMQEGAAALELPLVTVRTNLRRVLCRDLGASQELMRLMAPCGLAHLLQAHVGGMFLAAECSHADMVSRNSLPFPHPLLDSWLCTPRTAIRTHGMTQDRWQKLAALCATPDLLDRLVVCRQPDLAGARNCGRCEHCQETLLAIRAAGGPHPAAAFDGPLDLQWFTGSSAAPPLVADRLRSYQTMERHLQTDIPNPELLALLSPLLRRAEEREAASQAKATLDKLRRDPHWPVLLAEHGAVLAEALFADKPSARLQALLEDPPSAGLGECLLPAVRKDAGRGRMLRRIFCKLLRGDFGGTTT